MSNNLRDTDEHRPLDDELATLPRSIEPPRDLWPDIAPRLAPRRDRTGRRWGFGPWVWQAAAAVFFTALGAALALSLGPAAGPADDVSADSSAIVARAVDVSDNVVSAGAIFSAVRFAAVEREYLRVQEDLRQAALERRDELSPETLRLVERHLRTIDAAVAELRAALDADPENRQLADRLIENRRRSVDLLERLARGEAEI